MSDHSFVVAVLTTRPVEPTSMGCVTLVLIVLVVLAVVFTRHKEVIMT